MLRDRRPKWSIHLCLRHLDDKGGEDGEDITPQNVISGLLDLELRGPGCAGFLRWSAGNAFTRGLRRVSRSQSRLRVLKQTVKGAATHRTNTVIGDWQ